MAESGLLFRSLSDIADQIRRQAVSPLEVTRAVLDRLAHLNPRLNVVLTDLGEQALEAAKRAEDDIAIGQPRGPLHGVPLALKDIFALRGVQVTAGSQVLGSWIADYRPRVIAMKAGAGIGVELGAKPGTKNQVGFPVDDVVTGFALWLLDAVWTAIPYVELIDIRTDAADEPPPAQGPKLQLEVGRIGGLKEV